MGFDFPTEFDGLAERFLNEQISFAEAKSLLINLLENHNADPGASPIGFDLSNVDPKLRLLIREALGEVVSDFWEAPPI